MKLKKFLFDSMKLSCVVLGAAFAGQSLASSSIRTEHYSIYGTTAVKLLLLVETLKIQ